MAYALAGPEEYVGRNEVDLLATGDQMQAVLAGEGGEQAVARGNALGGVQSIFQVSRQDRGFCGVSTSYVHEEAPSVAYRT